MKRATVDVGRLRAASAGLGDAVFDPALWPQIMDEISAAAGATGAVLLQSDARTSDIPRTPGVAEMIDNYFARGWHLRDVRAERGVPLLLRGEPVITDQDIFTPREMARSDYYMEAVAPFGFQWFAAVGLAAGPSLWAMVIQRTRREGPFERGDKRALAALSRQLAETATLSKAVGQAVLSGIANAFDLVSKPVLALDKLGCVLNVNAGAEELFDDEIRVCGRRLRVHDPAAKALLDDLIDRMRTTPDTAVLAAAPIFIRRQSKRPIVVDILPIPGAARSPFLGARVLLVLSDLNRNFGPRPDALSGAFGLSPAEAKLASLIATGASPEAAAEELGIARETARNQLKAVFAKTATHRQGELIALLSRLRERRAAAESPATIGRESAPGATAAAIGASPAVRGAAMASALRRNGGT